jgi:hypothetical protein
MRKLLTVLGLALGLAAPGVAATPAWPDLGWLEGRWTADGGGGPGQASGGFSFLPEAGGQVLVRRNFADYPAQGGKPAERHDDLMVIYRDGPAARATYWDSEGQTIHYAVTAPAPGEAVFVSDDPAGPRFRLSYRRTAVGLDGRFEIAPPPGRDAFKTYLSWSATKAPQRAP